MTETRPNGHRQVVYQAGKNTVHSGKCRIQCFWADWVCVAVFQSDTEFWDKMQAEWEELARRNWLDESEDQGPAPPTVSPADKVSSEPSEASLTPQTRVLLWTVSSLSRSLPLFTGFTQDALGPTVTSPMTVVGVMAQSCDCVTKWMKIGSDILRIRVLHRSKTESWARPVQTRLDLTRPQAVMV